MKEEGTRKRYKEKSKYKPQRKWFRCPMTLKFKTFTNLLKEINKNKGLCIWFKN